MIRMNSYKTEIRVSDVVPNGGNPRRDFGDVAALAATMVANGGQPYTPLIVVPDGGRYRLVDGERRWRAMRSLGTERCDALVFASMGDAETAVAMMATDDSKALTDSERMRGFQSMLALGVDDEAIAAVVRTDAATVRRVRRIAPEAPEQATLDGLIAAADDEFSEEERRSIIAQGSRPYGDPEAEAGRIRKAHERARRMAAILDALPEGIDLRPGGKPHDPERERLSFVRRVGDPVAAARLSAQVDGEEGLVAFEDGIGYAVYRELAEGAMTPEEAARSEERRVRDEHKEAYEEAYREMCRFATEPWWHDDLMSRHRTPASRRPNLCDAVMADRPKRAPWSNVVLEGGHRLLGVAASYAGDEDPSCMEVCCWLVYHHGMNGLMGWSGTDTSAYACREFALVYDALLLDGWHPSEGAQAIRAMCPEGGDES